MYCRKCGKENPNEASFCRECGAALDRQSIKPKEVVQSIDSEDASITINWFVVALLFGIGLIIVSTAFMGSDSDLSIYLFVTGYLLYGGSLMTRDYVGIAFFDYLINVVLAMIPIAFLMLITD